VIFFNEIHDCLFFRLILKRRRDFIDVTENQYHLTVFNTD
jgi:hypothetical protein